MKEIILKDPFFWDFAKRSSFFSGTISLKISDEVFMGRIKSSNICQKSWDRNCTSEFRDLVKKMNDHREVEKRKNEKTTRGGRGGLRGRGRGGTSANKRFEPYDGNSAEDYVKCVCGGYTHQKQIKVISMNTQSYLLDFKSWLF